MTAVRGAQYRKDSARAKEIEAQQELQKAERQLALLKRQQKALQAHDDLLEFTQFTMPDPEDPNNVERSLYEPARYHRLIAKALQGLEQGEYTQLILCMPPRAGKSELATRRFVPWVSGRNPKWNIAIGSYSDTMAQDFGADIRSIMQSSAYKQVFPKAALQRGGTAKDRLQTDQGGLLVAVGRGGALTGRGAHLLVLDDVFKDFEEARSKAVRDQAWNWFTKVAMTRRMGKKLVLIIMTRWHEDDIVGRLTDPANPEYSEDEAKGWKIINLPAIAEENDPLGRNVGEALWPERFDINFLNQQKRLDPLGFSALYQQRPTVEDGILFRQEHVRYYTKDQLPADLRYYSASDHAVSTEQRADSTVLLTVGVDRWDNIYLVDCWWDQKPTDIVCEAMLAMGQRRKPIFWWAEKGHISKSIGPFLKKRMQETGTYINIREVTPSKDKETRAQAIAARMALGMVFFPREAPWTERFVEQLLKFPQGRHDDAVDALAYIGLGLRQQNGPSAREPERSVRPGTFARMERQIKFERQRAEQARAGRY